MKTKLLLIALGLTLALGLTGCQTYSNYGGPGYGGEPMWHGGCH